MTKFREMYTKNIVSEYICYDKFINENQTLDRKINKIDFPMEKLFLLSFLFCCLLSPFEK